MKIAYFGYLYDINGISLGAKIKAIELISELNKNGHDVKLYWLNTQQSDAKNIQTKLRQLIKRKLSKYLHEPNQLLANLRYLVKELRILVKDSPDIIISRLDAYMFSAIIVSKLKKIPIIIELDSPVVYEFSTFQSHFKKNLGLLKLLEILNLKYSNKIFTVTHELKNFFVDEGISPDKIHVISNGANIERFNPKIDKKRVIQKYNLQDTLVVGFVGTFHYWHGIENLMALLTKILSLSDNIRFLMVGSGGPMKEQLRKFIESHHLEARAILTSYIAHEEIPEYIASMDIVLAPYPNLDFFYYSPIKIYEYMACGKPVVTTRIGQISRLIKDGFNGCLCEPDNIDDIVQKISFLINDSKLRERIGSEARKTIVSEHSWKNKAQLLSKICLDVMNGIG